MLSPSPAILATMRTQAEAAMTSAVAITGPSTKRTHPTTGQIETIPGPPRYSGKARVLSTGGQAVEEILSGGQKVTIRPYAVRIPHTVINVKVADEVKVTGGDPALIGRTLIIVDGITGNDWALQRRLVCTLLLP